MKYAVLLVAVMLAGCEGGESSKGGESSNDGGYEGGMGKEIEESSNDGGYETFTDWKRETIQVAKEDFPNAMNWDDARTACENLGNGWRLPRFDELEAMHEQLYLNGKGNFRTDDWYWSSSESNASNAWHFHFEGGKAYSTDGYKDGTGHVRAVRTLP